MDSTVFFYFGAVGYFFSFILYLLGSLGGERWGRAATWSAAGAVAVTAGGVGLRAVELARVSGMFLPTPVSSTYETLAYFSLLIPATHLFLERRYPPLKRLGAWVMGLVFLMLALASSPLISADVRPLLPALQSYWLAFHVFFTLTGEAFFTVAFVAGAAFLWGRRRERQGREPTISLELLDEISYRAIAIGFLLFTLGPIIFGAIWAQYAWGSYWSWDPKETASLITWLVYALYLHVRIRWGWRDSRAAWLAVGGFLMAVFTWLGVNYLLPGLHSYA